jgi:hypothetical protein
MVRRGTQGHFLLLSGCTSHPRSFAYSTARHLPRTGRDHGRTVSKGGKSWSYGKQSCCGLTGDWGWWRVWLRR